MRVALAADGLPGGQGELHAAVEAVAGVDVPGAVGLALGEAIPGVHGGGLGRGGEAHGGGAGEGHARNDRGGGTAGAGGGSGEESHGVHGESSLIGGRGAPGSSFSLVGSCPPSVRDDPAAGDRRRGFDVVASPSPTSRSDHGSITNRLRKSQRREPPSRQIMGRRILARPSHI